MIKYQVKKSEENKTIERILISNFSIDRNSFYKALRKKDIKINGKRTNQNLVLKQSDLIEAYIQIKDISEDKIYYSVVFEDNNILIINKKQGIPVVNDSNNELSLIDVINKDYNSNFELCHRLDRNTGGLLIISKNKELTDEIKNEINNRFYNKIYKCVVWGNAENLIGVNKAWHFKDSNQNKVYIYSDKKKYSKEIITEIKNAKYNIKNNTTELEINLITGRTHQIRAHMAFLGHFIIGDGKYGVNEVNRQIGCKYQMLWACSLIPNNISNNSILPNKLFTVKPEYE